MLTYLVATGELRRDGKNLVTRVGDKGLLASLAEIAISEDSFAMERATLLELSGTKITLKMLGA